MNSKLLCICTGDHFSEGAFGSSQLIRVPPLNELEDKIECLRNLEMQFDYYMWIDNTMFKYIDNRSIIPFFNTIGESEICFFEFDFSWPVNGTDKQHIILLNANCLRSNSKATLSPIGNLNNLNLVFHRNLCLQNRVFHIIGDSHSLNNYTDSQYIFSKCNIIFDSYLGGFDFAFTHWIGARTMYSISLGNELAKLFQEFLVKPNDLCLLSFGEIDIRAHVLKQSQIQKRDFRDIIIELVDSYIKRIKLTLESLKLDSLSIIISGVIPPINKRVEGEGQIQTFGTIEDIVIASKFMNQALQRSCIDNFHYFDIYDEFSNSDGTLIIEKSDHFCHISSYHNKIIHKKLSQVVKDRVLI